MRAALLDALRSLQARRWPTLVAAGGLTLALSACLLLALLALALAAPDPAVPEPGRVVLLGFKGNPPGQPGDWLTASPVSFAEMLKERQVPLDLISRAAPGGLGLEHEGRVEPAYLIAADANLVPLLGLEALQGDLRAALSQRDGIAITADVVRRLWGELPLEQAIGRQVPGEGNLYRVMAVLPNADPRSLFYNGDGIVGDAMAMVGWDSPANVMPEDERKALYLANGWVLARLRPGVSAREVGGWMREAFRANPLYPQLPADWREGREAAYFRAITLAQKPFEGSTNQLRWRLLGLLAAACLLLLVLAAFNSMNLQTASLLQRQRETALRRSLGADGPKLLHLWIVEALLPLLCSAAAALLLAWWAAPAVGNWMGLSPRLPLADPLPWPVLAGLALAVLLLLPLTIALPAAMALRRAAAPALQGRTASEGPWGRRVRQGLLTLQLGGALLLLALTGVLALQQRHLLQADRGFETHDRLWFGISVNPEKVPNMDAFLAALERHPAVIDWAFSEARPAADTEGQVELYASESQKKAEVRVTQVSPRFFATYGMRLLAGEPRLASGETQVVIDAKTAGLLGFGRPQDAVGALLRGGGGFLQQGEELRRVVAVIADVKMESARDPARPQAFLLTDRPLWDLSIHGRDLGALREAVEALWKAHGPALNYVMRSSDELRAAVYREEQQLTTLLFAVALMTVWVAALGAYALVADTLRRRRTELVLHRLHGADHVDVARRVTAEFAPPLAAAAILALPLAAWLGERYLAGFVDRVDAATGLVPPLLAAAAVTLIVIALAALRHVQLALALQPIEALR